jgi:hypothetical protein
VSGSSPRSSRRDRRWPTRADASSATIHLPARRQCASGIVVCATVILLAVGAAQARAQISPGPLARPHASLEGPTNCTQCHGGRKESTTQKCLACHREIAWLREQGRGFHARRDARGDCSSCHPDHAGVEFRLIQWPGGSAERFEHAGGTGYPLEQSHRAAKCTACHTPALRVSRAAPLSPRRATVGWVGLERDCTSCHSDPHRGRLDGACTRCHDVGEWKDAPGFDHAQSTYPLTGQHRDVACAECHLAPRLRPPVDSLGKPVPVFRPVPFKDCASCHTDPHRGRLTGSCSGCHVTSSFRKIDRTGFDHDKTRYPLRGQHATVACASCHVGWPKEQRIPGFSTCASCHRDPHDGQATVAGKTVDCAACHRVEGFTPATYTVAQHQGTAFPLLGRHARTPCAACHATRAPPQRTAAAVPPSRPGATPAIVSPANTVVMRPASNSCTSCHVDAHAGELAARTDGGACDGCHSQDGWRPSTFGTSQHASLRLPLDGAHAAAPCASCHSADRRGLRPLPAGAASGAARVALRPPETTCAECHVDPHLWKKAASPAQACSTCHTTRSFHATTMDAAAHARTGYPLEGAHRAVPCVACHKALDRPTAPSTLIAGAPNARRLELATPGTACASCHRNPHGPELGTAGGADCDRCHTLGAFSPASRFDHARDARFPLQGAHARVSCVACHRQSAGTTPGTPLTYSGLSSACESCHTAAAVRPRGRP